jgi:hypothetical protein
MFITPHLLMIRPAAFTFNALTAVNNAFQVNTADDQVQEKALAEFDNFVEVLKRHAVDVTVVQDTATPHTPDSIFPNNWISFHSNGTICLYPMFAENRRLERKPSVMHTIEKKFAISKVVDYTYFEQEAIYLEGTGSMVLDRQHQIAYACVSPRTNIAALQEWCQLFQYQPVAFTATDAHQQLVYHTNVMMCVAEHYAIACVDCIENEQEKQLLVASLQQTQKTIIPISIPQMNQFAGNMLQVASTHGHKYLVMSSQAYESLTAAQIAAIEAWNPIIHAPLHTIETNGGGSARCMMAEVFLPLR